MTPAPIFFQSDSTATPSPQTIPPRASQLDVLGYRWKVEKSSGESWVWIAFWFFGSFLLGAVFMPLGLISMGLAIFYGYQKLKD